MSRVHRILRILYIVSSWRDNELVLLPSKYLGRTKFRKELSDFYEFSSNTCYMSCIYPPSYYFSFYSLKANNRKVRTWIVQFVFRLFNVEKKTPIVLLDQSIEEIVRRMIVGHRTGKPAKHLCLREQVRSIVTLGKWWEHSKTECDRVARSLCKVPQLIDKNDARRWSNNWVLEADGSHE